MPLARARRICPRSGVGPEAVDAGTGPPLAAGEPGRSWPASPKKLGRKIEPSALVGERTPLPRTRGSRPRCPASRRGAVTSAPQRYVAWAVSSPCRCRPRRSGAEPVERVRGPTRRSMGAGQPPRGRRRTRRSRSRIRRPSAVATGVGPVARLVGGRHPRGHELEVERGRAAGVSVMPWSRRISCSVASVEPDEADVVGGGRSDARQAASKRALLALLCATRAPRGSGSVGSLGTRRRSPRASATPARRTGRRTGASAEPLASKLRVERHPEEEASSGR